METMQIVTVFGVYSCIVLAIMQLQSWLLKQWQPKRRFCTPRKIKVSFTAFVVLTVFLTLLFFLILQDRFFTFFLLLVDVWEIHLVWLGMKVSLRSNHFKPAAKTQTHQKVGTFNGKE